MPKYLTEMDNGLTKWREIDKKITFAYFLHRHSDTAIPIFCRKPFSMIIC